MARWRIEMLGGLVLRDNTGGRVAQTKFYSQKTALMLARLALPPLRVHGREELIDLLWPDSDLVSGRASLRNVLAQLRRQLEPDNGSSGRALKTDNTHIWLDADAVESDVALFDGWLKRARRAGGETESEEALREAVTLYRGELLPGYYAEWLLLERARLNAAYTQSLQTLRDLAQRRGDAGEARDLTFRLTQADVENTEAADEDADRNAQATQPIRNGRPATGADADKKVSEDAPNRVQETETVACWLPAAYTRFFGRERELRELPTLLNRSRLVTLTGLGGVGKTRLAQEAARAFSRANAAPAVFAPLEAARRAEQIAEKICAALAISPGGADGIVDQVCGELRERGITLLILDNFEHLLTQGGEAVNVVAALLRETPRLTVLVTSRQPIGLPDECVYPLTPLDMPAPDTDADALMQIASVQLFADRARGARADFAVTPRNAHAVAAVCRQLEGIPLALEIAGARAIVMTPWEMRAGLEQRLDFLARRGAGGKTAVPSRHQSVRSALEWSHSLLTPPLMRCFSAFAAFRGGLTPDAARAVCEDDAALDRIEELCQVSLLCSHERGEEMRFCFLDTVREFAREKLAESGEENAIRARHFDLFLQMADKADLALTGPEQTQWLDRLEAEHDNMRAALEWALAQTEPDYGLKLGFMLWRFWQTRGYLREGSEWLRKILAKAGEGLSGAEKRLRAQAYNALGALTGNANNFEEARAAYTTSIRLFEECSPFDVIGPLNNLGLIEMYMGENAKAAEMFTRCLQVVEQAGETRYNASLLNNRGMAFLHLGQPERADNDLTHALRLYRQAGNLRGIAKAQSNLAALALQRGDATEAEPRLRESLRLHHALGDREACALCLEELAECRLATGEAKRGAVLLGAARALRGEVNAPVRPVDAPMLEKLQDALLAALGRSEFDAILARQAKQFVTTLEQEAAL